MSAKSTSRGRNRRAWPPASRTLPGGNEAIQSASGSFQPPGGTYLYGLAAAFRCFSASFTALICAAMSARERCAEVLPISEIPPAVPAGHVEEGS